MSTLEAAFNAAQKQAEAVPDIESYYQWQRRLEMQFDVLPPWFWRDQERRQAYVEYVAGAVAWRERTKATNTAATDNFKKLVGA